MVAAPSASPGGRPAGQRRNPLALTGSRIRRPEEIAGHAAADQRVKALGLDARRGGQPVPVPPAPGPWPHATDANTHPAGTESPGLPQG